MDALDAMSEAYALRMQMAMDQGEHFDEELTLLWASYVDELPEHQREFARSLKVELGHDVGSS